MYIVTSYKSWMIWQLAAVVSGTLLGLVLGKSWDDYKDARDAGVVA